ncbi:MAG TPA: hypothetical protein VEX38_05740, partial [Fimbriimonadaceae bacterium]|nr:hypothetical protein [Fimbriimonadaceae bacterium]
RKPSRRGRSKKSREETLAEEPQAAAAAAPEESTPVEEEAKPEKRSRRGSRGSKPKAAPESSTAAESNEDLPVPIWRARERQAEPASASAAPPAGEEGAEVAPTAPRRSRNRRRKDQQDGEITAEVAPKEERQPRSRREPERAEPPALKPIEKPPLQFAPSRPRLEIPADAPQVVLRENLPVLVRNHRVYPPIMFFGSSPDEHRASTVLDEMRMAGEAGVHLYSHLVEFEVDSQSVDGAVSFAAYLLKKTLEVDPDAQVLFRIIFVAPAGWQDRFPDGRYMTADGGLAEPSVCDDRFWREAAVCLQTFIRKLRMLPNKESILGLHLERGEWFYAQGWGYDTSPAARQKFRKWARVRYAEDVVALRAAWFDGTVNFDNLSIPAYEGEGESAEKFVRSSRRERRWVDYHLFLSDATVERIGDLAYAAKEASEGYFLVGASYGYTFEWSHPASGHLSLGKLLRTPEIDFIAGPPSYRTREPGGAAPFPGPIDSFALNGKLYISEEDFKTSIGGRQEPDDFNPIIKTPQALESVHWRGAGAALAHGSGVCWMDLWGNGWLKTPSIWERAKTVQESLIRRMECPLSEPDVAVFIDERALAYLVDENAFALLVQNVRESILRAGLSAGFYLLSDLQHREQFPESKLYIFLNAWDIRSELRAAIKSRLQRDNKVLFWLYAAGLFDSGRESLERAREVTGIALKPQPFHSRAGTTILNRRHPLCDAFPERTIVSGSKLEPSYFAIPEEATVLGEYSQTGLPS